MIAMGKKTFIALAFLILTSVTLVFVEMANANPLWNVTDVPRIKLLSPQPGLYYENNVNLSFYGGPVSWGNVEYSSIKYWLDGELKGTVNTALAASEPFSVNLTGLPDGQHGLEVTATVTVKSLSVPTANVLWGPTAQTSSGILNFTTDTTAPSISIMSQPNKTFETGNVPLNFIVSESVAELTYSLDEHSNVTFTNNTVLTHVYDQDNYCFTLNGTGQGSHSLKIYAKDPAGYTGKSETYYFTINTQPTQSPTPTPDSSTSPTPTSYPSPTMQPTIEPTQTPKTNQDDMLLVALIGTLLAAAATIAGAALILVKRNKSKPR